MIRATCTKAATARTCSPVTDNFEIQEQGVPADSADLQALIDATSASTPETFYGVLSANFNVERDGAPPGIRSRGIPIGQRLAQGATLAPTYACAPSGNST